MNILDYQFLGTPVENWLVAAGVAAFWMLIMTVFFRVLLKRVAKIAARTSTKVDDYIVYLLRKTTTFFIVTVSIAIGASSVTLPLRVERIIEIAALIAILWQVGVWLDTIIKKWVDRYRETKLEEDAASVTTMSALSFMGRLLLWTILFLSLVQNLGYNITSLIAGLGIGGIAVALAVQNILGDLFASLSIVLDKPFVIGDFLIVGDSLGTVEYIGLKTTRIRSLSGEQIVFSNSDLLNSRIRNFKRMYERRIVFEFGVVYQTPPDKLEKIPPMVKEIVEGLPNVRFDRAHFHRFGDFSLDFEVVYYVLVPDFGVYMDRQQSINLELYRRFQTMGVEFAYPTQTLFVEKANGDPSHRAKPATGAKA